MKKLMVVLMMIAIIGVSAFSLFACNPDQDTIIVGYDNAFPPMGFQDGSGKDVGFDLDLAAAVFADMGKKVEFRVIDWKLKETLLNSKEIDVIWNGYTITEERKAMVSFSTPYMKNSQCIVVKSDDTADTIEDIKDYLIKVQFGSSAIEAMYENELLRPSIEMTEVDAGYEYSIKPNSKVSGADTNVLALLDVENGAAQAAVMDYVAANYIINTEANAGKFRIISEGLWDEEYGIGVRKEDTELLKGINDTLLKLKENGELLRIAQKWGLEDALTDEFK
jgi:polar amino acid transport system substrate-binding protein